MDTDTIYKQLAMKLDALPNGFPATQDGAELRLLQKLFSPEEAALAALLGAKPESLPALAARSGMDEETLRNGLKGLARRGLINSGRGEGGLSFSLMPFIVGFYENQVGSMDEEFARMAEDYFRTAFMHALEVKPQFHRVIPIGENVRNNMEVHPYESATALINSAQAWGVLDCICRKQKALIGEACGHPIDVCMAFDSRPGVFDGNPVIHALTREEALATLERAAQAGLVHTVSNSQEGVSYICNCCTCSCGILRGMAEMGIANVVARSAFVNTVDETLCTNCETCVPVCSFDALSMGISLQIDEQRCVGCGTCVTTCPTDALVLVRRPEEELMPIPATPEDWRTQRSTARGL